MFKALLLQQENGQTTAEIRTLSNQDLPAGEVTVEVEYSSLNYKDGLAVTGKGRIIREFPFVPGIDLAGTVIDSQDERFSKGDQVILTGWGVGERHWGGFSQRARVNADWLIPLPAGLTTRQAMIIGTAGLTAMLCVMTLEEAGVTPDAGRILVTGASGGVGSLSVALLKQLGHEVTAVTGRTTSTEYLLALGADEIIPRTTLEQPAKPLESQRWAGIIDTAGGAILARALAETCYGGCVAVCGLAADYKLNTTVMPFILRNVSLRGVDSVQCPTSRRTIAWERLARLLPDPVYQQVAEEISLDEVVDAAERIMQGRIRGRVLVNL
ncbi:MAG TPA: oxidoreductase [Gammaproteobacteria bacterium]|nr:oxidoreductase [Gammaproteobacteria bacterium]